MSSYGHGYNAEDDPSERKAARTERIRRARAARAAIARHEEMRETLGEELTAALARYLAGKPEFQPLERAISMIGYSDELKRLLVKSVELNPAMEESFLKIAELAYEDGREAHRDDMLDYPFEM